MPQNSNPWDLLSRNFNTHLAEDEIDPAAADNIVISWPPILQNILQEFKADKNVWVLDFGCGTGGFSKKLSNLGFEVVGVDSSQEMINVARKNSSNNTRYVVGNQQSLSSLRNFHVIVSLMTIQFIKNFETTIDTLVSKLKNNGLLIFSVFNREWVKACLKANTPFSFTGFDLVNNPKNGFKEFKGGIKLPVYNRTAQEYDEIVKNHGLKKVMEEYPPFTKEFTDTYSYTKPTHVSEFMILGYRK